MAKIYSDDILWTTDIGLATTLMLKYPLLQMDTKDTAKVAFGFTRNEEVEEYVQQFWDKGLQVEPQAFYSQLLMLRKRINQELAN